MSLNGKEIKQVDLSWKIIKTGTNRLIFKWPLTYRYKGLNVDISHV